MDNELRSGKDKKSDDMLEQTLDKALMLFRYISVRLIHSLELQICLQDQPQTGAHTGIHSAAIQSALVSAVHTNPTSLEHA